MRQTKTRLELFSFYDHVGIAAHLERQARAGWLLESIGNWGWKYRRMEPRTIKFCVTYFPRASAYDPGPSEQERTFRAYCEEAGWKLAAASAQMQVFFCEEPDPIPIETDAELQVENIHAAARKTHIFSHALLGVLGLMQMLMWLVTFFENPIDILADYTGWFRVLCWGNLLLLCAVELISYYRWHGKAVCMAKESGILYPTKSRRGFQMISLVLVFAALILWITFMQSHRVKVITLLMFGYMVVLLTAVNGCRLLLKKWKVSTNTNRVITILVDVVLAFGMMGLLTWGVLKMDLHDRQPVDVYEYYGMTREVYADELPVAVEDLMDVDPAGYSRELKTKETVLAAIYDADQNGRRDWAGDRPNMNYRFVICKVPAWTDWLWDCWMEDYPRLGDSLVEMDPGPWGAEEAYREWTGSPEGGDFTYTWIVRWEDRFLRLNAYWELTTEQMEIIGNYLNR